MLQNDIRQAVILAGGLGTRMRPLTDIIPKPMIEINGKPFLEHLILILKENGIKEVVLLLGYKSEKVISYFSLNPVPDIKIVCHTGEVDWNTGTRVKRAEHLYDDTFLLMYCDNYWPLRLSQQLNIFKKYNPDLVLTVYNNNDNYTKNNIHVNKDGKVTFYDPKRMDPGLNGVDIGFFIFRKSIVAEMPGEDFHLTNDFISGLIKTGRIYAHTTDQVYYSIGSMDRLPLTAEYLKPKKIIFIDRDGVINKKAPKADYVKSPDEFIFLPGVLKGLKLLTENDYKIIIITNQAGIARGMMTENDLTEIHNFMLSEIENNGGKIERIYHCPHGWDDGCSCRKPKPGMLLNASKNYVTDITKSLFIGDDERDLMAAEAANMNSLLVYDSVNLLDIVKSIVTNGETYTRLYYNILKAYKEENKPVFTVAIGGCSRAGKSTLAEKIKQDLIRDNIPCELLALDCWIKGFSSRKPTDTVRERFDYDGITQALTNIHQGKEILIPSYDAKTRCMTGEPVCHNVISKGILIVEGVVALDNSFLRDKADFKVFVDLEDSIRINRVRNYYREFKQLSRDETEELIIKRERDEVGLIKENIFNSDFIFSSDVDAEKNTNI